MSRFIMPRQGVNGQNLNPGDGAQLFFKNEGLTTDRDTFSDEDMTTANENPVTADATGLFPAIWMDGNYDVSLKDKNGVQLWGPEHMDTQTSTNESIAAYVADMVATSPDAGTTYQTTGYIVDEIGGAGTYLVKTAAAAATDGDTIDELTNHTLANGNVAILQHDGIVDFRTSGGRAYTVASPIDNSAALLAADAQGFTIRVVGGFYFSVTVDLGLASTNTRTQILGVENTNVDGDTVNASSIFIFSGTAGITVDAGAKIEDIEFENIGALAGSGTGLVANNIHSSSLKNITCSGFERGFYIFAFQSRIEMLMSIGCTTGIEFYGECTSLTVQACWARNGTYGFIIGPTVTYSTLLNCAVDGCFVPYTVAGDNVHLDQCGAEINLDAYNISILPSAAETEIEGYIRWDSTSGAASTVSVSGGRYIMVGALLVSPFTAYTAETAIYSVAAANNESSVVNISRMTSNSFQNLATSFSKGKLRIFMDDSCTFADTGKLFVKEGEFGSIMMNGRSSGTLRRYAKKTPKVGSTQADANSIPNMLSITIEEIIDFGQVITDTEQVFIKFAGVDATSFLQGKVEVWPMERSGSTWLPQKALFVHTGGGTNGFVRNDVMNTYTVADTPVDGTIMDYLAGDAAGTRTNFYFTRTAIQCKCFVRIIATGWCDSGFRDSLITLVVGPDDQ